MLTLRSAVFAALPGLAFACSTDEQVKKNRTPEAEVPSNEAETENASATTNPEIVTETLVNPVVELKLSSGADRMPAGTLSDWVVTAIHEDGSEAVVTANLLLTSSDSSIVQVLTIPRGRIKAMSVGQATLTATYLGVSVQTEVEVYAAILLSVTLEASANSLAVGAPDMQISAKGRHSDGQVIDLTADSEWVSSNPSIATIGDGAGNKGLLHAVSPGSVTVTSTHTASGKVATKTLVIN